jgi:uncharacterized protein (UPF0248 family)
MPPGKPRLKEIVDEHLHRAGLSPADLVIVVADRTIEGGERALSGAEVAGAGGGFVDLKDGGRVPFHRVLQVRSKGRVVYERGKPG